MPEIDQERYQAMIGSDTSDRDGMYLEVWEAKEQLLEVFYSDLDGAMTFTAYRPDIPLHVVEWAIAEAKGRLPPESKV